jgi:glycosyltransferase involved in cell wall biosynthesis
MTLMPAFTLGIATWNRADWLERTLGSLAAARVPADLDWEVLVCDNNSTDTTRQVVESMGDRLPIHLFEPTQGKSHALNRILRQARHDWVLMLDDDVLVDPGYLEAYVAGIERYPDAGCLGGQVLPALEAEPDRWGRFMLEEYPFVLSLLYVRGEGDRAMSLPFNTAIGPNMALRKSLLPPDPYDTQRGMIGGKRVAGEDVGIMQQVLKAGHSGHILKDAIVQHYVPADKLTLRFYFDWEMGTGRTWTFHRGKPKPGRLGVHWWMWKILLRRALHTALHWRPWPTRAYIDAYGLLAREWGYMKELRT